MGARHIADDYRTPRGTTFRSLRREERRDLPIRPADPPDGPASRRAGPYVTARPALGGGRGLTPSRIGPKGNTLMSGARAKIGEAREANRAMRNGTCDEKADLGRGRSRPD